MRRNLRTFTELVMPHVAERVRLMRLKQDNPSMDWEPPNDFITWHIEASNRAKDPYERQPAVICERLNLLNILAGHTSPTALSNFVIDLYSLSPEGGEVAALREEVEREYAACGGQWTQAALNRLDRVDSALRESFRLHPLGLKVVERKVMKAGGVHLADGLVLPQGARVAVPNWDIQTDPDVYGADAAVYDPFRYSRAVEAVAAQGGTCAAVVHARRVHGAVTPSPEFLHFGLGRHACPGRIIAVQLLKMDIAYILMNYDVEPIREKPRHLFRNMALLPQVDFSLKVRRRQAPRA